MMGAVTVLGILLLPLLIVLFLFLPKRSTSTWFNTFSQQGRGHRGQAQDETETEEEEYYNQIPASEDIIDVKAEEVEEKENK
jgi:hypothetical protein